MAKKLSRRKFFRLLGAGMAAISVAGSKSTLGILTNRKKIISKAAVNTINSEKRAELRKLLHEMRTDLRRCKESLIARKKEGKSYGHLASQLHRKQRAIRNYHIALSEMRGKKRDQIERPRVGNLPCDDRIEQIKRRFS